MLAKKINNTKELKQAMISDLKQIINRSIKISGLKYKYVQYPWELIDTVQGDLENLSGNSQEAQTLKELVNLLQDWYVALIELGNTVNIPDERKHNWFAN